jgi:biotin carboxyl carrier protein
MLKVQVTGNDPEKPAIFEITKDKGISKIDGLTFTGDILAISENHYHVIWNNKSYNVEITERDEKAKTCRLLINGKEVTAGAKDQFDLLLEGMGIQASTGPKINHIKAPMPGLIQSVAVQQGDEVQKGDTLLVLVAMKMENVIKSSGSGQVKSVKVAPGEIVEKNQVLLEFL